MSESNLIECKYSNHFCKPEDFTKSGLKNGCYAICRGCETIKKRKYREKYNDKLKEKVREGNRIRQQKKRLRDNFGKQQIELST